MFAGKTSFTSHMSRKHRHWAENVICASIQATHCETPTTTATIQEPASVSDADDTVGDGSNFCDLYLKKIYACFT